MSWFDKEKPSTPPPAVEAPPTMGKITDVSKHPAIDAAVASVEPALSPAAKETIQSIQYLGNKLRDLLKLLGSSPELRMSIAMLDQAVEVGVSHVKKRDSAGDVDHHPV